MNAELPGDFNERPAGFVVFRRPGYRHIGHLAGYLPPRHASTLQVARHRGPVQPVPASESIGRRTVGVLGGDLLDLGVGRPPLDRV